MNTATALKVWTACEIGLSNKGYKLEQVESFDQVPDVMEALNKKTITPMLSPLMHDFTEKTCAWLVLQKDGTPLAGIAMKLEDIGSETVLTYWPRAARRHYGDGKADVVLSVAEPLKELSGRLVYYGELMVAEEIRGSMRTLGYFARAALAFGGIKWDPDWHYAFLRPPHAERGAGVRYGFTRQIPGAQKWIEPAPEHRSSDEVCVALPRGEWEHILSQQNGSFE